MALNSINTNIAAYYAQANIGKASSSASSSVSRLSSGNRIVRASDDVASLAAGTSLRTAVTTLRMAMINTSQGGSLLQVADGALAQITDILQRQKAISIQAGAGSMAAEERSFLNQEFQELSQEIDRLASSTNFNGVSLLDGSVFDKVSAVTKDESAGKSNMLINFVSTSIAAGKTLTFNGVVFTSTAALGATGNNFFSGDTNGLINDLVQRLNASTDTRISGATYTREGNALVITQDAGGAAIGRSYTFAALAAITTAVAVVGTVSTVANTYLLQGGDNVGLGFGRTTASGIVGDNLLTAQNQVRANQQITIPPIGGGVAAVSVQFAGKAITFNDGAAISFNFIAQGATPTLATDIVVGTTVEETLDNAVQTMRAYANLATSTAATTTGATTKVR